MSKNAAPRWPLNATLYKSGVIRLSAEAALALGQKSIEPEFFRQPRAERPLLSVALHWDRSTRQLTIRGGEGPFKLRVYPRVPQTRSPLFMILAQAYFRRSRGLRVPAARRFPLVQAADRTLILDREGESVKVSRPRPARRWP